ncbi:AAEL001291-PA [Aedes aegypti]|uniref:AAEL001291-PA n=1 Tax=Aedes aegypti TaxID=7159 RepID=Q17LL9_AEDAE|nr:AAEL001291-PA [Aedes aegypti]
MSVGEKRDWAYLLFCYMQTSERKCAACCSLWGMSSPRNDDTIASLKVQYRLAPEGDKNFVRFDPIDLKLKFPKAKFYFTGLFNGDPALEEFGNQAINDNPNLILDEVKPSFEKNLGRVFTDISNSVVEGAEEFELLPP